MKSVSIYTDGACRGNPGPGGFASILIYKSHKKVITGSYRHTTNNRMELLAVIKGLELLKEKCAVKIFSDSKYICDAINQGWLKSWKINGWKNSHKENIKNLDLWLLLDNQLNQHLCSIIWVKGHADNTLNNEADEAAVKASKDTENFLIDSEFEKISGLTFG